MGLVSLSREFDRWDVLMAALASIHVFMAPYTKVEESFNIQGVHDVLYHRRDLQQYDHFEFPGVVPRTFVGPIFLSFLASPVVIGSALLNLPKLVSLYSVRLVLGAIVLGTLHDLRKQVTRQFGSTTSTFFAIITTAQFHLLFYCSRPLPNIYALAFVNLSFSCWLRGNPKSTLRFLVFAAAIFRCDIVLLLGPVGLCILLNKSLSLWSAMKCCVTTAILAIGLSIVIDSVMWQRLVWPEFEVLWFNSVLNRSSEWGIHFPLYTHFLNFRVQKVSPPHWYFTSALPRAMTVGFPLALAGVILERRVVQFVLPVLGFIVLYSKLPHKELRFIIVGIPILNVAAAAAAARIYNNRHKVMWGIAYLGVVGMILSSFVISLLMAVASYANYPGGHALRLLHINVDTKEDAPVTVHIDVLPAMTGISRFCEEGRTWSYSKEEGLLAGDFAARNFTFLLNESRQIPGFKCIMAVPGFSHLQLQAKFPPVGLVQEPKVFVHSVQSSLYINHRHWPGCDESAT